MVTSDVRMSVQFNINSISFVSPHLQYLKVIIVKRLNRNTKKTRVGLS